MLLKLFRFDSEQIQALGGASELNPSETSILVLSIHCTGDQSGVTVANVLEILASTDGNS